MKRNTITLVRNAMGFFTPNSIGTDGFNAISSIPVTEDVQIESEFEDEVVISYLWTASDKFLDTNQMLSNFNLCRKK